MISIFDIFKIGIGPSSSHTVAPMKAAKEFRDYLLLKIKKNKIIKIDITLFGSLAYTGRGHGTDEGIILGLLGQKPEDIDNKTKSLLLRKVLSTKILNINKENPVSFNIEKNFIFNYEENVSKYSNVMIFTAYISDRKNLEKTYYSIGGGFIKEKNKKILISDNIFPYNFSNCNEMLRMCEKNNFKIHELIMKNERSSLTKKNVIKNIFNFWNIMEESINNGIKNKGILKGSLKLKRRAPDIYKQLKKDKIKDPLKAMDWASLYAIAVNEENASSGRVVTAPTNGAAGIIPSVVKYYLDFTKRGNDNGIIRFFLTAGAIGILYKENASISGAEVGCQGEVGVACSMAAAGLVAALNGTNKEIENAAEIAMEHNLGLTCDPVGGLVQIPCIERNAMGAVKAINAARLAMIGKGKHKVRLDEVIKTMYQTGKDMQTIYKETSNGGLAVNVTEC